MADDGQARQAALVVVNDQEVVEEPPRTESGKIKIPDTTDAKELWDHFQQHPDFFQAIKIDHEAGFDEIQDLWSISRVLFGVASIFTLLLNLWTILSFNWNIFATYVFGDAEAPAVFLVSGQLIEMTGLSIPNVAVLAALEVILVGAFYVWGALNFTKIFNPLATPCTRWHAVSNFFFNCWPTLATVAMVKLLNFVTPQVLTPTLMQTISRVRQFSASGPLELVWFLVSRIGCFFLGFDAFLYRFQLIGLELADWQRLSQTGEQQNISELLLTVLFFVFQILGIVQLGVFTKQRIFIFIFAGEDGQMSEEEDAIKRTWEAMVCAKSYEIHGFKAIFIWMCFSDADFQKMVLDSKEDNDDAGGAADGVTAVARMLAV